MAQEWWKTFFNEIYLPLWEGRGLIKEAKKEVDFLKRVVGFKKGDKILDLCCGHGRHTLELARRGYEVTGFDYSAYELVLAKKKAATRKLQAKFIKGDARYLRFNKQFDVVLNLFSSAIGYGSDEDTRKILSGVGKSLKKGGYFLLDTLNASYILRNYKAKDIGRTNEMSYKIIRWFDPLTFINHEEGWLRMKNKTQHYKIPLRIFTYPEIKRLLEDAGLKPIKVFGSLTGDPYTWDSKRITVLARKI